MKRAKKMQLGLERRRDDYDKMTGSTRFKAPQGAYHKPGSNKK